MNIIKSIEGIEQKRISFKKDIKASTEAIFKQMDKINDALNNINFYKKFGVIKLWKNCYKNINCNDKEDFLNKPLSYKLCIENLSNITNDEVYYRIRTKNKHYENNERRRSNGKQRNVIGISIGSFEIDDKMENDMLFVSVSQIDGGGWFWPYTTILSITLKEIEEQVDLEKFFLNILNKNIIDCESFMVEFNKKLKDALFVERENKIELLQKELNKLN